MARRRCSIREIVPRQAIATVARVFYGEPYLASALADLASFVGVIEGERS